MDIKKEREAFEEYISNLGLVEFDEWNFKLDECEEYLHEPTNISWGIWRQKQAEIDEIKAKLRNYEIDSNQLLTERDQMQEFAEQLKDRLQEVFNQDFGDHSNANCPFTNALEYNDSGFVLVPKEPTGKMISAGYESKEHINNLIVNYKAMIEAAQGEGHE